MNEDVDIEGLVDEIRARVEQRKRDGQYPAEVVQHLNSHFRRVTDHRAGPDLHMLRVKVDQLEHVANFSPTRIPLESGMPGGSKLHGVVAKVVSRQTNGILMQMQEFADAVVAALRIVLAETEGPHSHVHADLIGRIDALFEHAAAWERGVDNRDRAEVLQGCEPVLVVDGDPLESLEAVVDGSLGGIALVGVIEHLTPRQAAELCRTARAKLRPGGRVVVEGASPPLHPAYVRSLLEEAGFAPRDYAVIAVR